MNKKTTKNDQKNNFLKVNESGLKEQKDFVTFIHDGAYKLKPDLLFMSELKWKVLVRSVKRAKNIMMTGHSGCGKTLAAHSIAQALDRPFFKFNLGATQDPRSALIGYVHFDKEKGTYVAKSDFIKAITTPNAVILLDEFTRAHPEASNILMTPLDQMQRYLRLDEEQEGHRMIDVADGVTFIATANIGNEYTGTRTMDRAAHDRFITIEMDLLNKDDEYTLLRKLYPSADKTQLKYVAEIADATRNEIKSENPRISTIISTRISVEIAGLLNDGFNLKEVAEIAIYPFYPDDGGTASERTFIKQLVQKYEDVRDDPDPSEETTEDGDFNPDDMPF